MMGVGAKQCSVEALPPLAHALLAAAYRCILVRPPSIPVMYLAPPRERTAFITSTVVARSVRAAIGVLAIGPAFWTLRVAVLAWVAGSSLAVLVEIAAYIAAALAASPVTYGPAAMATKGAVRLGVLHALVVAASFHETVVRRLGTAIVATATVLGAAWGAAPINTRTTITAPPTIVAEGYLVVRVLRTGSVYAVTNVVDGLGLSRYAGETKLVRRHAVVVQ